MALPYNLSSNPERLYAWSPILQLAETRYVRLHGNPRCLRSTSRSTESTNPTAEGCNTNRRYEGNNPSISATDEIDTNPNAFLERSGLAGDVRRATTNRENGLPEWL